MTQKIRFLNKQKRNIRLSSLDTDSTETDDEMETSSNEVNSEQVNEINTTSIQVNSEQVNDMRQLGIVVIEEKKSELQKPFLKWVGGKTQLITKILSKFPREMENYHELFLGGGSILLGLLSLVKMGKINITHEIYAYDLNKGLINTYNQIKNNPLELRGKHGPSYSIWCSYHCIQNYCSRIQSR